MTVEAENAVDRSDNVCWVEPEQLPLSCPTEATELWNMHPKVFLDIESQGQVSCPYCGTLYRLKS